MRGEFVRRICMGNAMSAAADITDLIGRVLTDISATEDQIVFTADDGTSWRMLHHSDCCEAVYVEDIAGDLDDLIGSPIVFADEATSNETLPCADPADCCCYDSVTWTFYRLATVKGYVTIRWYGGSNGYYSEAVDFERL